MELKDLTKDELIFCIDKLLMCRPNVTKESLFRLIEENRLSKISDEQVKILVEREKISNSLFGDMDKDLEKLEQIDSLMIRYKVLQKKEDRIIKNDQ